MTDLAAALTAETKAAPLGPDSLTWRLGLPRTMLLLAGRGLLMQVAHPQIGSAVHAFSIFREDPWGRLERSITSLQKQLFGGPESFDEARRLRQVHAPIHGVGFGGIQYDANGREGYAWTHLTGFDTLIAFRQLFVRKLRDDQIERLYSESRQAGLVLGVREAERQICRKPSPDSTST